VTNFNKLQNGGASQAQPASGGSGSGGGFFGWLGNLFSGVGSFSIPSIPSSGGGGTNLQPYQFPNQQIKQQNILNNPVVLVGIVLAGLIIIKKINE
jgi:hypothetical protein